MIDVNKLLSAEKLGTGMFLVEVDPTYEYDATGTKTDHVDGYKYTVVLPEMGYEKLSVKIAGSKMIDCNGKAMPVAFERLELRAYSPEGKRSVYVTAKARGIVSTKN